MFFTCRDDSYYNIESASRFDMGIFIDTKGELAGGLQISLYYPGTVKEDGYDRQVFDAIEKDIILAVLKRTKELEKMKVVRDDIMVDAAESILHFISGFTGIFLTRAMQLNKGLIDLSFVQEAIDETAARAKSGMSYEELGIAAWDAFANCARRKISTDPITYKIDKLLFEY